jgi:hypothetical protein
MCKIPWTPGLTLRHKSAVANSKNRGTNFKLTVKKHKPERKKGGAKEWLPQFPSFPLVQSVENGIFILNMTFGL